MSSFPLSNTFSAPYKNWVSVKRKGEGQQEVKKYYWVKSEFLLNLISGSKRIIQ
jgi:hypothetical protein